MTKRQGGRFLAALWILILVSGAGCSGTGLVSGGDPVYRDGGALYGDSQSLHLKARVAEYWEARIQGDLVKTYMLHEPAYRRAATLTAFAQGRGATPIFDYAIQDVEFRGTLGIVKMKIRSSIVHPMLVKPVEPRWGEHEEQWVQVDGEWYRKFRFPVGDPYRPIDWDEIREKSQSGGR